VSRRATGTEPAFGTDSFLDVTANLVGVLIVLIVLIGMRVRKMPFRPTAIDAEIERRLSSLEGGVNDLAMERLRLAHELEELRRGLTAKQAALAGLRSASLDIEQTQQTIREDSRLEEAAIRTREAELAEAKARLVSLSHDFATAKAAPVSTRQLVHRSPLSQAIDSEQLHLELLHSRVTFIDLAGLMDRVRIKCRSMEPELRALSRVTSETGAIGPYRLRFTMAREDLPFSQSMFYSSSSFHARLVDWRLIATQEMRGEPVDEALGTDSQLDRVLARHSPNKYAITLWTYSDSFSAFRQLRDALSDRGYIIAARPLPMGLSIQGAPWGSQSMAQ
jgi:hypothetical protein